MKAVGIKTLKNRLSEYVRLASRGEVVLVTDRDQVGGSHGDDARTLIGRVALLELVPPVLALALAPFPVAVRTLDALHLASLHFLREQGQRVTLATCDARLGAAADALGFAVTAP